MTFQHVHDLLDIDLCLVILRLELRDAGPCFFEKTEEAFFLLVRVEALQLHH